MGYCIFGLVTKDSRLTIVRGVYQRFVKRDEYDTSVLLMSKITDHLLMVVWYLRCSS